MHFLNSSSGNTLTGGDIGALCMGIITALFIVFIVYTKWFKKPKKIKPQIIVVAPVDGKKNLSKRFLLLLKNNSAMLRMTRGFKRKSYVWHQLTVRKTFYNVSYFYYKITQLC